VTLSYLNLFTISSKWSKWAGFIHNASSWRQPLYFTKYSLSLRHVCLAHIMPSIWMASLCSMASTFSHIFCVWSSICSSFRNNLIGIMFMFLDSLHCISNTCKVVQLVMDMIGMNCCWRGCKGWLILIDLQQLWQITFLGHPSQIAFCTLRENRCLGLPSNMSIVLLAQTMIPIVMTMWIFLVHE